MSHATTKQISKLKMNICNISCLVFRNQRKGLCKQLHFKWISADCKIHKCIKLFAMEKSYRACLLVSGQRRTRSKISTVYLSHISIHPSGWTLSHDSKPSVMFTNFPVQQTSLLWCYIRYFSFYALQARLCCCFISFLYECVKASTS